MSAQLFPCRIICVDEENLGMQQLCPANITFDHFICHKLQIPRLRLLYWFWNIGFEQRIWAQYREQMKGLQTLNRFHGPRKLIKLQNKVWLWHAECITALFRVSRVELKEGPLYLSVTWKWCHKDRCYMPFGIFQCFHKLCWYGNPMKKVPKR